MFVNYVMCHGMYANTRGKLIMSTCNTCTVKPPNKGRIGDSPVVPSKDLSEVLT